MCWEYGILDGILRFAGFLYVGSLMLMVALLIGSLIARVAPTKSTLLITSSIVIVYAVFHIASGDIEVVRRGAIFGGVVGLALGIMIGITPWLASSHYASKLRTAESSLYSRMRKWLRRKRS